MQEIVTEFLSERLGVPPGLTEVLLWATSVAGGMLPTAALLGLMWRGLSRLRRPSDSPALAAFREALASGEAVYDRKTWELVCPDVLAGFDAPDGCVLRQAMAGGVPLLPALSEAERKAAGRLAASRRDEIIERERLVANEKAAAAMGPKPAPDAAPAAKPDVLLGTLDQWGSISIIHRGDAIEFVDGRCRVVARLPVKGT